MMILPGIIPFTGSRWYPGTGSMLLHAYAPPFYIYLYIANLLSVDKETQRYLVAFLLYQYPGTGITGE